jgi:erythromycin esterase-like protein
MNAALERTHALLGVRGDYDRLLDAIGDARYVLIGEASHGTHEFYAERARITRRLIEEKGFGAVAAEADWPDAYRVTRWLARRGEDRSAEQALSGFRRFPAWMWRNTVVRDFVSWLHRHNERAATPVGFYGLDLYSLFGSIHAVLAYLDRVDPAAARRARSRYACFDHFREDSQAYGYAASFGMRRDCEEEVVHQLVETRRHAAEPSGAGDGVEEDERFAAAQNARLVKNAEEYYRTMFGGRVSSWNLRDTHMADTLDELAAHLSRRAERAKIVVWAHNSHLGDARATEMGRAGEINLGQLVRERHPGESFSVGFSTFSGTVTASDDWDEPARVKTVRPGLPGSYEALFHDTGHPRFLLLLRGGGLPAQVIDARLQRAIGVIYRPETERMSHYFQARLADQFDAIIHLDETQALRALEAAAPVTPEPPETFPTGM